MNRFVKKGIPTRLFYGQNIIPEDRKLGYVWVGRYMRGGAEKTVKWGHPNGKGGWEEKEYQYKYSKKHLAGGFNWSDFTIRKFAKINRKGNIVWVNGDMVRNYTLDIERYQRGKKKGQPKLDKNGNYIPISPKDYARVEKEMYVEVTPNWQAAIIHVRKEYSHRWDGKGGSELHRGRRTVSEEIYSKQKRNKYYLDKVWAKRQFNLAVRVGFLYPDEEHGTWGGHKKLITYRSLIAALMFRGYDPLMPLRDMAYINKIRSAMGRECGEALDNGRPFEPILRKYGIEMRDYVYEYIMGGIKPPLAENTIKTREYRERTGFADYPAGIDEPLVETSELANNVDFEIIQSDIEREDVEEFEEREARRATPKVEKKETQKSPIPTSKNYLSSYSEDIEDEYNKAEKIRKILGYADDYFSPYNDDY